MTLSEYLDRQETAAALARKLGVAHSTVKRWARGELQPSVASLRDLHDVTAGAVTPNDFVLGVGVREHSAPDGDVREAAEGNANSAKNGGVDVYAIMRDVRRLGVSTPDESVAMIRADRDR